MKLFLIILMACFLVGCGPSKREVELESQLEKTEQRLEKTDEILANTESELEELEDDLSTTENKLSTKANKLSTTENKLSTTESKLSTTENKLSKTSKELAEAKKRVVLLEGTDRLAEFGEKFVGRGEDVVDAEFLKAQIDEMIMIFTKGSGADKHAKGRAIQDFDPQGLGNSMDVIKGLIKPEVVARIQKFKIQFGEDELKKAGFNEAEIKKLQKETGVIRKEYGIRKGTKVTFLIEGVNEPHKGFVLYEVTDEALIVKREATGSKMSIPKKNVRWIAEDK